MNRGRTKQRVGEIKLFFSLSLQLRSRAQIKPHTHLSALCLRACVCVCVCVCVCIYISSRPRSNRHRRKACDTRQSRGETLRPGFAMFSHPTSHFHWLVATHHCQKDNAQKCPEHSKLSSKTMRKHKRAGFLQRKTLPWTFSGS